MTLEEYKKKIFKTDGNGDGVTIGDVWETTLLTRKMRRYIQTQLKKGRVPDFVDVLHGADFADLV